jgi:hypothetical protein
MIQDVTREKLKTRIRQELSGIDRTQTEREGWWETSTGAEFGAERLAAVLRIVDEEVG